MSIERTDITLPPDLSRSSGTGPVRLQEPVYVNSIPPCNHACPAGENIQAWLDKAQAGEFEEAWRILVESNPMPSTAGSVTTLANPPATVNTSTTPSASTRLSVSWAISPWKKAGYPKSPRKQPAKKSWLSARVLPACPRPGTWPSRATRSKSATPVRWLAA